MRWEKFLLGTLICFFSFFSLAKEVPIVAVVGFANLSSHYIPNIEQIAIETLSALLAEKATLKVVERSHVEALINELGFVYSGLVDQEKSALSIGRMLGANIICLGVILDYLVNTTETQTYGVSVKTTTYTMQVSIKFINVETGELIFAKILTGEEKTLGAGPVKPQATGIEKRLLNKILVAFANAAAEYFKKGIRAERAKLIKVRFDSNPQGASVVIDGIYVGSTPFEHALEEGKIYVVQIVYPGYEPWEMKIKPFEGLQVYAVLKPEENKENDANSP